MCLSGPSRRVKAGAGWRERGSWRKRGKKRGRNGAFGASFHSLLSGRLLSLLLQSEFSRHTARVRMSKILLLCWDGRVGRGFSPHTRSLVTLVQWVIGRWIHHGTWRVAGAFWNSLFPLTWMHRCQRTGKSPVPVCFYCYFFKFWRSLGESAPSRFHPKQRMAAIDFYPLPKHCISFRLHQRHNPSFRIFFIT